jgi:tyrosine-protein phosphatase YwqE
MAGYQPILAHPERYTYLNQNRDVFDDLRTNGCLFQLNLLSMGGGYGKATGEMAKYLLQNGFYSLVGTDAHHDGHLERLKTLKPLPELGKLFADPQFLNPKL